ncbi:putative polyphosphate kinase [Helianthus anomalus]
MEHTYQYAWMIPFLPLPVPMLIGLGLLLFSTATKSLRRMWAFQSQINSSYVYQYVWSWIITNHFSLEFGYLIDPITSIMSILITTVGILVLIYSDNYITSMLGLVTSSNLIQIYIFWELVGMCSYLLIGFWFTRPVAAKACQKAFV